MHHKAHGYFGLICIGNVGNQVLTNSFVISALQKSSKNAQEVNNLYGRVRSDMIENSIEGSITKTAINKIIIYQREYEWADAGCLISNDVPNMIQLLLKESTQIQGLVFIK